jgi:signal transduction histidine kinase
MPPLLADEHRLVQVVTNLVSHALKFTPDAGKITLRVGSLRMPSGPLVYLSVLDNGPGIPEEFREKIFDAFIQAPSDGSASQRGTGLGLSICMRIVQHYGGRIFAGRRVGAGAAIHVLLPAPPTRESVTVPLTSSDQLTF